MDVLDGMDRRIHPEGLCKKSVFKHFYKIHKKTPGPESFLNKIVGLRAATLLKKSLRDRCFPMSCANLLRTLFYRTTTVDASACFIKIEWMFQ